MQVARPILSSQITNNNNLNNNSDLNFNNFNDNSRKIKTVIFQMRLNRNLIRPAILKAWHLLDLQNNQSLSVLTLCIDLEGQPQLNSPKLFPRYSISYCIFCISHWIICSHTEGVLHKVLLQKPKEKHTLTKLKILQQRWNDVSEIAHTKWTGIL